MRLRQTGQHLVVVGASGTSPDYVIDTDGTVEGGPDYDDLPDDPVRDHITPMAGGTRIEGSVNVDGTDDYYLETGSNIIGFEEPNGTVTLTLDGQTVDKSQLGPLVFCQAGDCPEGEECVEGECVPIGGEGILDQIMTFVNDNVWVVAGIVILLGLVVGFSLAGDDS